MFSNLIQLATALLSLSTTIAAKQAACVASEIPRPGYFGTEITEIEVKEVTNWQNWGFVDHINLRVDPTPLNFCNVTLTYTHPGLNDTVHVYVWLPLNSWNGRFLAQGGGGWAAGNEGDLAPAVALGYAGANTDAGHSIQGEMVETALSAKSWALASPGNVNWVALQDFAATAIDDFSNLAKQVTTNFYGVAPKFSYWNGCSTGGRQGLINAQRYPYNYDGILAAAPAINWVTFLVVEHWGHVLMRKENYYPPACEMRAITAAAIEACDELDGVKDGMVAASGLCHFDATSVVGQSFDCDGQARKISASAARLANGMWEGPKSEWFGLTHETSLVGIDIFGGLLETTCDEDQKNCKGSPFPISTDWIQLFLAKDPEYDPTTMTEEDFYRFLHVSRQRYTSVMDSADPDLSEFRRAGGKMITWHGLADQLIFPNGSSNYYERVLSLDPKAADFYRYFEAPGVAHCMGGDGAYPGQVFNSLVDWVEKGKAPDSIDAKTMPALKSEAVKSRPLCPYPQVAAYKGGAPDDASSYECAENFGTKKVKANGRDEL